MFCYDFIAQVKEGGLTIGLSKQKQDRTVQSEDRVWFVVLMVYSCSWCLKALLEIRPDPEVETSGVLKWRQMRFMLSSIL